MNLRDSTFSVAGPWAKGSWECAFVVILECGGDFVWYPRVAQDLPPIPGLGGQESVFEISLVWVVLDARICCFFGCSWFGV